MIPVSLQTLSQVLGAELIGSDRQIDTVTTDTRSIVPGALFIALIGEKFDAHDFAAQAVEAGAAALIVSKRLQINVAQLVVADTRLALGQLGAWVRQQVKAKVVALTGSSGKTSVKEMTAAILRQCGQVLYTSGNFNNDIGVPLTLLRLTKEDDFAVIELGANHPGEIAYTTQLVCPQTALVNNLAAAHLQGFGSLSGVAQAKGEIFTGLPQQGVAILNADNHDEAGWHAALAGKTVWRFSATRDDNCEYLAKDVVISGQQTQFTLCSPFGTTPITLPLPGKHNIANALAASALALSVGASLQAVRQGLSTIQSVPGRLFPVVLSEGKILLDDSYNANVGSMTAAIETLASMPGYRVLVVGDMGELGEASEECHRQVGEKARQSGINHVLSVGNFSRIVSEVSGCGEHFQDKTSLVARLTGLVSQHAVITILIKGSRSAAMEQVVRGLQESATC
jgi:UDP-N-acetylmuramoyl-tripeptide--D-alanyl-D-alanine ligase